MPFQPATKKRAFLRMAIIGPAGSGKTRTALEIAKAFDLGRKFAVIDSEHDTASLYAPLFQFDVNPINGNYAVEEYITRIAEAAEAGYPLLIIDSLSHAWAGEGGVLSYKDAVAENMHNDTFRAWTKATPKQNALVEAILSYPGHVIVTIRVKMGYVVELIDGKNKPRQIGLEPIQRDTMAYEFDVTLAMDQDHVGTVTKTRCDMLDGYTVAKPGTELARVLKAWLTDGAEPVYPMQISKSALDLLRVSGKQRLLEELVPAHYPDGASMRKALEAAGFPDYDPLRHAEIRQLLLAAAP